MSKELHQYKNKKELIHDIRTIINEARSQVKQAINSTMVLAYWQIGYLIVEDEQAGQKRADYGQQQLKLISKKLTGEYGKGFDITNLRNMRRFYLAFQKQETLSPELSWSHYNRLSRIKNLSARTWYMQESCALGWSVRALDRQINKLYYERLLASKDKAIIEAEAKEKTTALQETTKDYLRDPYILDFLNLPHKAYLETELEQCIISNLQQFLLELGKGFAFVERQQRIRFDDEDFYIDLVFYNRLLHSFVLIDIKIGKIKHQDIGQMQMYVNYFDRKVKTNEENPTIGIILCKENDEFVVEFTLPEENKQIFSKEYKLYLPNKEELQKMLETYL